MDNTEELHYKKGQNTKLTIYPRTGVINHAIAARSVISSHAEPYRKSDCLKDLAQLSNELAQSECLRFMESHILFPLFHHVHKAMFYSQ